MVMTYANPDIVRAVRDISARNAAGSRFLDYYEGRHKLAFATSKFNQAFGDLFRAFADNYCRPVVNATMDRLTVTGFQAEGGDTTVAEAAWQLWQTNRMDLHAMNLHRQALIWGCGYVLVWPGRDEVRIFPQKTDQVMAWCDEEDPRQVALAAKLWLASEGGAKRARLTLYYPDRIEKWVSREAVHNGVPDKADSYVRYEAAGEPWPLPNPYSVVPVVPFDLEYSDLADVLPVQDALNKEIADMLVSMEFTAFPQRWATGLEVEIDPETGKAKAPFVPGADRVWATGSTETSFGQFDAADLAKMVAVQDSTRLDIARLSNTPLHYLMPSVGQFPSGESLKTAEAPFTAKCNRYQVALGNGWEDTMRLALTMAERTPSGILTALWAPASTRDEKAQAEVLSLRKGFGLSDEQALRESGYSEGQITAMMAERAQSQQAMGAAMLTAFDRGQQQGGV